MEIQNTHGIYRYDQTKKKSKQRIISLFRVTESLMWGGTTMKRRKMHTERASTAFGYVPSPKLMSGIQNTGLEGVEEGETMRMETIQQLFYYYSL